VIFDSQVGFKQGDSNYSDGSVVTIQQRKSSHDHVIAVFKAVKLFWSSVSLKSISDGLRTLKHWFGDVSIKGPAKIFSKKENLSEGLIV
jgi:hypothetical protein